MNFISFGSGSSGNCYYIKHNGEAILIDAGIGLRTLKKAAYEYNIDLSLARALLITHDHADHVKSVGSLSTELAIPVYATSISHHGIEENHFIKKKVSADKKRTIVPGEEFSIGPFRITPIEVPHDSHDCVGYFIIVENISFCLLTDIGEVSPATGEYISRANYLVIEANYDPEMLAAGPYPEFLRNRIDSTHGHLSNIDCARAITSYATPNLHHVWLCHLSQENNHPVLARKTVEMMLRQSGICVGVDFQMDVLNRKRPTGLFNLE
ncbi:MAG: MBL fold metallo-hydrolase [Prevotella sp.]|nr:MBL fold metallo-hydrolase [Prevotella sp.]